MLHLKQTQIAVLRTLAEHKNEWLGVQEILYYGSVKNSAHINNAINFFLKNDLVYQPNYKGKVMISPDGIDEISEYMQ